MEWTETLDPDRTIDTCLKVGETVAETTAAVINRIALVQRRATVVADPGVALARQFCQERWWQGLPLNRADNFELHAHRVYQFSGRQVNSWVRCKTGEIRTSTAGVEPAIHERGVVVEQDLNTMAPEDAEHSIDRTDIRQFFNRAPEEAGKIFGYYFPES